MIYTLATILTLAASPTAAGPAPTAPQLAGWSAPSQAQPAAPGGLSGSSGEPLHGQSRQAPSKPRGGPVPAPEPAGIDSSDPGAGESGGTENAGGGGPGGWTVTSGPITNRPSPPPTPNAPPEAEPGGGMSLLYYLIHIGGFGMGTQTGYWEDFCVFAPDQTKPRPLLVVFHKFGVSQMDIWINTSFFQEATRKGWHIVAPLSASGVHMGSIEGQINTEKALDWMFDNFNIDKDRIYGVGFSMGGGGVTNFAARHLDQSKYTFAALVDHTGGIAHEDTYVQSPAAQFIFDFWFGDGSPGSTDPFLMARSSLLDFDPDSLAVAPDTDLARNLVHVPTKVTRASIEPQSTAYLQRQCDILVSHLAGLGGHVNYQIVPFFGHTWDMLDERATVDWLGKHRLEIPTSHATLADSDARYFHFDVTQDTPLAFTPFSWDVNAVQNALTLTATENLSHLGVDLASAGLSAGQAFELNLSTADNLADEVSLQGWSQSPTAVHRDGVQQFVNWVYNASEQLLTLQEWDGTQTHQWIVTP